MSQIKKQEKAACDPNDELFTHLPKSFQVLATFTAKISNKRMEKKANEATGTDMPVAVEHQTRWHCPRR